VVIEAFCHGSKEQVLSEGVISCPVVHAAFAIDIVEFSHNREGCPLCLLEGEPPRLVALTESQCR